MAQYHFRKYARASVSEAPSSLLLRTTSERTYRASAYARLRQAKRKRSPRRASDPDVVQSDNVERGGWDDRFTTGAVVPAQRSSEPKGCRMES
jgi:hypothetical protein